MFQHHELPRIDPFSTNVSQYVFVKRGLPLIQHEWLSDLILFSVYAVCGPVGLLLLTATLTCFSLVFIPSHVMLRYQTPRAIVILAVSLAVYASSFRLWVRPEAFSFLCTSILIYLNEVARFTRVRRFLIICVLVFLLFVAWSNLHAVFIAGIGYLIAYYTFGFVQARLTGRRKPNPSRVILLICSALAGSLCTPWRLAFWHYLFHVARSPVTHLNKENGHLMASDVHHPTFIPLILFYILFWAIGLAALRNRSPSQKAPLFPFMLSGAATVIVVLFRRLTPLALLMKLTGLGRLYEGGAHAPYTPAWHLDAQLSKDRIPGGFAINALGLAVALITCFYATVRSVPPQIPAPSGLFSPPYKAIAFLDQHCPAGRMLNDSKFGSMMTWCLDHPPDIFIDGRFDSFDPPIVYDYQRMRLCQKGWRELLDKYGIAWVFFPPETPIIKDLEKDPSWTEVYRDASAVILEKSTSQSK
jgi:hypothetical protein